MNNQVYNGQKYAEEYAQAASIGQSKAVSVSIRSIAEDRENSNQTVYEKMNQAVNNSGNYSTDSVIDRIKNKLKE